MNENSRRVFAEKGANPKYYNMNHTHCKRCGKQLYTPMPCNEDLKKWGAFTFVILIIGYLFDKGWRAVKTGDFNADYVCPDCLTEKDTDYYHPTQSAIDSLPRYKEWIIKMRKRYGYEKFD